MHYIERFQKQKNTDVIFQCHSHIYDAKFFSDKLAVYENLLGWTTWHNGTIFKQDGGISWPQEFGVVSGQYPRVKYMGFE